MRRPAALSALAAVLATAVQAEVSPAGGVRELLLESAMVNAVDRDLRTCWTPPEVPTVADFYLREPMPVSSVKAVWRNAAERDVRFRVETLSDGVWKPWTDGAPRVTDALRLVILGAPAGTVPALAEFSAFGVLPPEPGAVCGLRPDPDGCEAPPADAPSALAAFFYRARREAVLQSRVRCDSAAARRAVWEMRRLAVEASRSAANVSAAWSADCTRVIARLDEIDGILAGGAYPLSEAERFAPVVRARRTARGEAVVDGRVVEETGGLVRVGGRLSRLVVVDPGETAFWQAAIDRMSAAGGGTVTVPRGRHAVGSVFLRDNVTLELAEGAVLEGIPGIQHYAPVDVGYAEVREPWYGLVCAVGVTNVALVGRGEVFGNGAKFRQGDRTDRPRGLLFLNCRNVRLEGVFLHDLASWTCYLRGCDGVTVRRVRVDSHANSNNDGLDIDSRNVLVEDCDFDSDDDGIVLKSDNPRVPVENVTVRDCRVRSNCSALKLGTGSHGGFVNILFERCVCGVSARATIDPATGHGEIADYRVQTWPGSSLDPSLLSGIAVESVDGARAENIVFRDISIAAAASPIFIRGGTRYGRCFGTLHRDLGIPMGEAKTLKGVLIENVTATATSFTASSITGTSEIRPTDIVLRNVAVSVPGAGEAGRAELGRPVPEKERAYPESNMFDARMLPAYGLYIRHADNVRLENVRFSVRGSEVRPELVTDDVTGFVRR